jgi:dolichyl-phosphate-mannose-protein mannosyltransferase
MRTFCSSRQDAGRAVLIVLGCVAMVIFANLFDGSFVLPDSAQYLSMAKNVMAGHGVATSLVWTEEHHRLGGMPVPQTNLPPGYPILIVLVSQLGVDPLRAAFLVSLVCFSIVPLVLYRILRAGGRPAVQSVVVSGTWLVLPIVWANVLACLSEMSYTLLTLLSLACVGQSERRPTNRNAWLLLAGTLAGLSFTVRYAGIIYITSLGALFLLRAAGRRDVRSIRELVLVGGPPTAFVLALFVRNYRLAGTFAGGVLMDESNSTGAVLYSMYWALSEVFGYSKTGLLRGDPVEWFLVLFVVSALGCLAAGLRLTVNWRALRAAGTDTHGVLSSIYVVGSLVVVVITAKAHTAGTVDARYLLPLIPFALLLVPYGQNLIRCASPSRRQQTMAAALRWGVLAVFVAGQVSVVGDFLDMRRTSGYRQIDRALHQAFGPATLRDFLNQRITVNAPLLGNSPQLIGAVLGKPVVGLPGPWYTRTVWTEDEARRVVARYGVAYVVFFPDLFDLSQPDVANQIFFRDLKQGRVPRWLEPTYSSASVRLYQVNPPGA